MSRRAAEKEIDAGNVRINGGIASLGDKVDPELDTVTWNGDVIHPRVSSYTYVMLNKPMGYVTTMDDEKGRKTASELVSDVPCRVYPVGRLDMYSEGLLFFTNDGELTNRLTHPSGSFSKVYSVKLKGILTDKDVKALEAPMELDGYKLRPVKAEKISDGKDSENNDFTAVRVTLFEGRNRQIRKMCEKCGYTVMRLRRISECGIDLGDLPVGKWRYLTEEEVRKLKES